MKTLVWGACGFMGRHLVHGLLRQGHEVAVLTFNRRRYVSPAWHARVSWYELAGDTELDQAVIAAAIRNRDVIYSLAGASGAVASNRAPIQSLDSICRAHLEFLEACVHFGSRPHIVFASSRLVYGNPNDLPVTEDAPLQPQSIYAANKISVEHYLRVYANREAITYAICRITNPYGFEAETNPKDYGFLNRLIRHGIEGRPLTLFGEGEQLRDYVHVSDLVDGLMLAGTLPQAYNQTLNLGFGQGMRMVDAIQHIQRLNGSPIHREPWPEEFRIVESGSFVASIDKARVILGYQPRISFEQGLALVTAQIGLVHTSQALWNEEARAARPAKALSATTCA